MSPPGCDNGSMTTKLSREPRMSLGLTMERQFSSTQQNAGQGRRARYGRRISQIMGESLSHRTYPDAPVGVPGAQCDGQEQHYRCLLGAQRTGGQVYRWTNENKQHREQQADCRSDVESGDH